MARCELPDALLRHARLEQFWGCSPPVLGSVAHRKPQVARAPSNSSAQQTAFLFSAAVSVHNEDGEEGRGDDGDEHRKGICLTGIPLDKLPLRPSLPRHEDELLVPVQARLEEDNGELVE